MSTSGIPDMDFFADLESPFGDASTDGQLFNDMDYSSTFTAVNDHVSGQVPSTVSPKDLMKEAESAPPSTAFTNLSTPMSAFENSPSLSSYQTSPMVDDAFLSYDDSTYSGSLFPDANPDTSPASYHTKSFASNTSYTTSPAMTRTKSSPGESPGTGHGRHSSVSGVSRRTGKPLGPVACDKADPVSVKRARNTEAARKSRARKLEKVDGLEEQIERLQAELKSSNAQRDYYRSLAERHAN